MSLILDGTNGETFPSWTTATRPASPTAGQMGYNSTTGLIDAYTGSGWNSVPNQSGGVIQVVQGSTTAGISTTSSTYVDTSLTASITPKFSTSKILVLISGKFSTETSNQNYGGVQILRGSSAIYTQNRMYNMGTNAVINGGQQCCLCYLDSPATTSSTTYKLQICIPLYSGSYNFFAFNGDTGDVSTITLMEIAA